MTQQLKQYNDSIKSRPDQRVYRVRRGTFHRQQRLASMEGQAVQGGKHDQHLLFHGVGDLEYLLLQESESKPILDSRPTPSSYQRYLARPDVEISEFFEYGSPDPY